MHRSIFTNGTAIRKARKLTGYRLIDLAARANISFQYLSQIELGRSPSVSPPVFARLCDALGVKDRQTLIADRG